MCIVNKKNNIFLERLATFSNLRIFFELELNIVKVLHFFIQIKWLKQKMIGLISSLSGKLLLCLFCANDSHEIFLVRIEMLLKNPVLRKQEPFDLWNWKSGERENRIDFLFIFWTTCVLRAAKHSQELYTIFQMGFLNRIYSIVRT